MIGAVVLVAGTPLRASAAPGAGIWSDNVRPRTAADPETSAAELGTVFVSEVDGWVTAIRYYKSVGNRGPHVGKLWSSDGQMITSVAFTVESPSGWQTADLASPVRITKGRSYTVSYRAPYGRYADDEWAFSNGRRIKSGPLTAIRGVYTYGSGRPTLVWHDSSYYVDVKFINSNSTPTATTTTTPTSASAPTPATSTTTSPSPTPTTTPSQTTTPSSSARPTQASTTVAPSITASGSTTTSSATSSAKPAACVGSVNSPGGADPWGGCWPGPHNTGFSQGLPGDTRAPVTLTSYTGPTTISKCGVVIDSKIVSGDIVVTAGNGTHSPDTPCVTIKNSLVKGVIHTDAASYGPVVVSDTEVAVPGLSWWENIGRYNVFVWRVNSHGSEGVIKCADYCAAYDSWVHGMYLGGQYHYNAFGGNGMESAGGYFTIEHNWASCGDWVGWDPRAGSDAGCSADIGFYGDFAPIRNITINRNYLAGATINSSVPAAQSRQPGYCLNPGYYPGKPYPDPANMKVTDNVFGRGYSGKCGAYGPTNSLNGAGKSNGNVWENNKYDDGAIVDRPEE